MTSVTLETNTSSVDVTNISQHGFCPLLAGEGISCRSPNSCGFGMSQLAKFCTSNRHPQIPLHWPELDVDLAVESVRYPQRFPLVSQVGGISC